MKRIPIYLATLPWDLLALIWVGLAYAIAGERYWFEAGALHVELLPGKKRPWMPEMAGAMTLCHTVLYMHEHDRPNTIEHEGVHVEQQEAAMCAVVVTSTAVLCVTGTLWLALLIWTTGGMLQYGAASITAWLRGEDFYRGNTHEESAYGQEG